MVNAFALLGFVPPERFRRRMVGWVREGVRVGGTEGGGRLMVEEVCILLHSFGQLPALALEGEEEEGRVDEDKEEEEEKEQILRSPASSSSTSSSSNKKPKHIALALAEAIESRHSSLSPINLSLVLRALARIGVHPLPSGFLK